MVSLPCLTSSNRLRQACEWSSAKNAVLQGWGGELIPSTSSTNSFPQDGKEHGVCLKYWPNGELWHKKECNRGELRGQRKLWYGWLS